METIQSINLIATNPNVRGGRPCIAGTTIEVSVIAIAKIVHMRSPDDRLFSSPSESPETKIWRGWLNLRFISSKP